MYSFQEEVYALLIKFRGCGSFSIIFFKVLIIS
jgi:hypothetical protein